MDIFYLIDFENVHNNGIENIDCLTKEDHVHIFSTQNALDIRPDIFWLNGDIQSHLVPARKQSLDMHLVSYFGYLLGIHGRQCSYVIVSNDTDYDNIIKYWKEEGYQNISRKQKLPIVKTPVQANLQTAKKNESQTSNRKIRTGMAYEFSGDDRSRLNLFMQHELISRGHSGAVASKVCKYVIAHCNDEQILFGIHNDIKAAFEDNNTEIYSDVKSILEKFVSSKNINKDTKREAQVRSFFGQNFKKKLYTDRKEQIIGIILNAKTKQQVNHDLLKLYSDGKVVKHIYQTMQPLIKDLPGK